jgi:hypothetical protein
MRMTTVPGRNVGLIACESAESWPTPLASASETLSAHFGAANGDASMPDESPGEQRILEVAHRPGNHQEFSRAGQVPFPHLTGR